MHKRSLVRCLLGLFLGSLLLGPWPTASVVRAHALLVRSSPAAGAEVALPPVTIDFWFSEPLEAQFSYAYLVDAAGNALGRTASVVDAADPLHLILTPPALAPGIYTVAYHTLSQSDGHEWLGSFPLTVLNPDGSRPSGVPVEATAPESQGMLPPPLKVASRWFSLLGVMVLAGALVFRQLILGRDFATSSTTATQATDLAFLASFDQYIRVALILGMGAVFIGGWLQVMAQMVSLGDMGGQGGATLDLFFQTRAGMLIVARQLLVGALLLLTIVGASLAAQMRSALQWVMLFLTLALLATFAVGSHAAAVAGSGWAIIGDFIHLLAAGIWLGGLGLLALLLWQWRRQPTADALLRRRVVGRFSAVATLAVFVLSCTGLFSTLVHLQSWALLWATTYGRVLLLKLGLVLVTLGLALRNHRLVHSSATKAAAWTVQRYSQFARQVWGESGLALALIVVVAILVQTPVPQPTPVAPTAFFETILRADDLSIHLQISPNQVGDNRYIAHLFHEDGSSIGDVQLVRLRFEHQTAALGQSTLDLAAQGGGFFGAAGAYQNQAGPWDIALYVRRRGLDDILATTTVTVPPVVTNPARNPWQNPIATLPTTAVVVAALIMLGLLPVLWRYRGWNRQ